MKTTRSKTKKQPRRDKTRTREELLALSFDSLLRLAERGSEDAAEELSQRLIELAARFLKACYEKPELFYAAAKERSIWPGLIVLDPWVRSLYPHYDLNRIRKRIHLGDRRGLKYDGKLAGSAVGSQIARRLFTIIDTMRREEAPLKNVALPKRPPKLVFEESSGKEPIKFTPKESALVRAHAKRLRVLNRSEGVLKKWWKVMKPLFIKLYGNDFEKREEFAHHWQKIEELSLKKPLKYAKDYQKRNEVRRRILKDVTQGLHSIAARQPAT